LAPTSWKGQLPEGMKRIIASETTIFGTLTRTAVRDSLDAPIQRMAIPDVPTPYNVILMNAVLPQVDEIAAQMTELIEF
jgi:pyruvate/2-oxoglutarate/acetoin dehydrogenase E1 component